MFKVLVCVCMFAWILPGSTAAQGKFEFGFHYSRWSLNILKGYIEEGLSEGLESQLKDGFLEDIHVDHPGLMDTSYRQDVEFDASGNNYGFEFRWYPGGYYGSFSLGLSIEKTSMTISLPEVSGRMELSDGSYFEADANAAYIINPLSFHLSFRWDIFPSSMIHPYFTFGFGAATGTALETAELNYGYEGTLYIGGTQESYQGDESQTLQELKEEMEEEDEEFFLPGFIPFVQLSLGIKGELTPNIHLLVDAGIWNGFLLRGGIAFRF